MAIKTGLNRLKSSAVDHYCVIKELAHLSGMNQTRYLTRVKK